LVIAAIASGARSQSVHEVSSASASRSGNVMDEAHLFEESSVSKRDSSVAHSARWSASAARDGAMIVLDLRRSACGF
jgi:hypothetical protein